MQEKNRQWKKQEKKKSLKEKNKGESKVDFIRE